MNGRQDMPEGEPVLETVPSEELARLRRIEAAAKELLQQMEGRRKATPMLEAMAKLRAALKEAP